MRPDPRAYLWDALHAAELLAEFSAGKSFADYQAEAMLDRRSSGSSRSSARP
jgi:uncharacterized protein with HEPN domain